MGLGQREGLGHGHRGQPAPSGPCARDCVPERACHVCWGLRLSNTDVSWFPGGGVLDVWSAPCVDSVLTPEYPPPAEALPCPKLPPPALAQQMAGKKGLWAVATLSCGPHRSPSRHLPGARPTPARRERYQHWASYPPASVMRTPGGNKYEIL